MRRNFRCTSLRATFQSNIVEHGVRAADAFSTICEMRQRFIISAAPVCALNYEADPKLGACLEVAEWRGGNAALETALFAEA